jgi:hypothetical protein
MADEASSDEAVREQAPGTAQEADEPDGGRTWRALGTLLGAVSLVGGLTWVLLNLHGPAPYVDLAAGVVLALGGLILLMPHRIHLPRAAWLTAAGTGVAGTAAGIASGTANVYGMFAYVVDRGFPFRFLQRGGVADDPEVARRLAATDSWQVDVAALTIDVLVWAYLGLLVFVLIRLVRRPR